MNEAEFYKTLGRNLKAFRDLRDLSGSEVAKKRSIATDSVYKYEQGVNKPSIKYVVDLAVDLDTNVETLLQGLDPRKPKSEMATFHELRVMSPEEHAIAQELATTWEGDVKALIFWSYLYAQVPPSKRGELAIPIVMETEQMIAAGQLDAAKFGPIVDYVRNATGGLLDVSKMNTGEVCPK